MSLKLTLNIQDKELIGAAKTFARSQNKSLSVLVENILRGLVKQEKKPVSQNKLLGAFISDKTSGESDSKWEYLKEKFDL
ncbi:DUF6364 family protein [Leadbetterella sp. DM7]|uniref:DUF6364 family protein n=1 Tax=Leadbetterella sp. DM7 TaxID=3235085 RepID=UPI00349E6E20